MSVNFICVGAAKAGTTSLHDLLKLHPEVFLPEVKELHFFDDDEKYAKGIDWYYDSYFKNTKQYKVIGEITPSYIMYDKIPQRIFDSIGKDVKLVFMFRNPAERAFSQYAMHKIRGKETLTFNDALEKEEERISKDFLSSNRFSYLKRGFYYDQVQNYLKFFPRENMHFILFEDFITNRDTELKKLLDFLDLKDFEFPELSASNTSTLPKNKLLLKVLYGKSPIKNLIKKIINPEKFKGIKTKLKKVNQSDTKFNEKLSAEKVKEMNNTYYKEDIEKLAGFLNKDLSSWL